MITRSAASSPARHRKLRKPIAKSIVAATALLLLSAIPATAQTNDAAFVRQGNELFRSGQYAEALARYREANAAGVSTGLLHYNLGVTYYRLGQYAEAATWLERAIADPEIRPLAAYNLGVAYAAAGDSASAEQWFATAAASADGAGLRPLAEAASQRPRAGSRTDGARRAVRTIPTRGDEPPAAELRVVANAAYGTVDNANRSPSEPYRDLSQPGAPLVTPEPISATVMPINLLAEYVIHNESGDNDFIFSYEMDGNHFDETELVHTEATHELRLGADLDLGARKGRSRSFDSALFAIRHNQDNFDPDSGLDRSIEDIDISNRFAYTAAGMEANFAHTLGSWSWGFEMSGERREYQSNVIVENYDQEIYRFETTVGYQINAKTAVGVGLIADRTLYDERLSRELDGALLTTSDPLEYVYDGIELRASRQLFTSLELELTVLSLDRTDTYDNYNDYSKTAVGLRAIYRPHRRFMLAVGTVSRAYDYANAFAFNNPAAGAKELDAEDLNLVAEFQATRSLAVSVALETTDVTSTDARAEYSRSQTAIGVIWRR